MSDLSYFKGELYNEESVTLQQSGKWIYRGRYSNGAFQGDNNLILHNRGSTTSYY